MTSCRIKVPLSMTKLSSIQIEISLKIVGMVMALKDIESLLTLVTSYKVIEVVMEN